MAFGEEPQEWLPTTPPQYGKVELMAGLANYTQNANLQTAGSSPGKLNVAMGQYTVNFGYNFLLTSDYFGPKLQVGAGYMNTNFSTDDSTPTAFTTMRYGGLLLSLAGQFPISEEIPVDIGGKFDFFLHPSLSESKSSGGSSSNKNQFVQFFCRLQNENTI